LYRLLGGQVHERLRSYTYIYPRPDQGSEIYHVRRYRPNARTITCGRVFTALNSIRRGPYSAFDGRQLSLEALDRCEQFVRVLREAVDQGDLLFGTNGQMTAAGAIRLARRLERYDPLWFEEPVPPTVRRRWPGWARDTIPIATGERLTTKYDFARPAARRFGRDLANESGRVGGLLRRKRSPAWPRPNMCRSRRICIVGPVGRCGQCATGHLQPEFPDAGEHRALAGFHSDILKNPIRWQDGYVIPPTAAGLGVELNEEFALRHPTRQALAPGDGWTAGRVTRRADEFSRRLALRAIIRSRAVQARGR